MPSGLPARVPPMGSSMARTARTLRKSKKAGFSTLPIQVSRLDCRRDSSRTSAKKMAENRHRARA